MIKIVGFEYEIKEFTLTKKFNHHSECSFRVNIYDAPKEDFLNRLGQQLIVEDGECLFFGEITEISADIFFDHTEIIVRAFSCSIHLDLKPQKRIFQNPDKTLKSMVDFIKKDSNFQVVCGTETKISSPILQCGETDFAFIVRMAHAYGKQVLVNDNERTETPELVIMDFSGESVTVIEEEPEQLSYQSIYFLNEEGKHKKTEIIEITTCELYINLGQRVKIDDKIRYAAEVNIRWEKGAMKCRYLLFELDKMPLWEPPSRPEQILLKAVVEDNNDTDFKGRIKVRFECDYFDAEPDKQTWIPYKTPYLSEKGGFVFLPDQGDIVEIIYSNDHFSANEITGETPLKEEFRNVNNKYIANIFGKQICFTKDQLELNSDGNTLILSEHSIIIDVKGTKISVEDGKITLKAGKNEICIDGDSYINRCKSTTIRSDSKIEFEAEEDITIMAKKNVSISGGEIHLKCKMR